jgi:hypothetical protein
LPVDDLGTGQQHVYILYANSTQTWYANNGEKQQIVDVYKIAERSNNYGDGQYPELSLIHDSDELRG